jgi:hypothetical protein
VRRAQRAGWANPEAAADLKDEDMDPRTPRPEYVQEILDRGVGGLSSSDSVEEDEFSEATTEKLEDLAALFYRAHGPTPKRHYNTTGAARPKKHKGSDLFPDLDVDQMLAGVMEPLLDQVKMRRREKAKAAMLQQSRIAAGDGARSAGAHGATSHVPPESAAHIIIPDEDLSFEWMEPRGGEAGREVEVQHGNGRKDAMQVPGMGWVADDEAEEEAMEGRLPEAQAQGAIVVPDDDSQVGRSVVASAPRIVRCGAAACAHSDRPAVRWPDVVACRPWVAYSYLLFQIDEAAAAAWKQGEGVAGSGPRGRVYIRRGTHSVYGIRKSVVRSLEELMDSGDAVRLARRLCLYCSPRPATCPALCTRVSCMCCPARCALSAWPVWLTVSPLAPGPGRKMFTCCVATRCGWGAAVAWAWWPGWGGCLAGRQGRREFGS